MYIPDFNFSIFSLTVDVLPEMKAKSSGSWYLIEFLVWGNASISSVILVYF